MEFLEYGRAIAKYWRSSLAILVVSVCVTAGVTLIMTPTYTAYTSVFFAVQGSGSVGELASGSTYAERQVRSYTEVAVAPIVLQPVIDVLGLDTTVPELAKRVRATVPQQTAIVEISVEDPSPATAARIANEVAGQLILVVDRLTPLTTKDQKSVQATVISPAGEPLEPTSPRWLQNLLLATLAGLAVGVGQALARNRLDTRVRTTADVAKVTGHSVLGDIIFDEDAARQPLIMKADPHSQRAEAYRRLRTNLQFLDLEDRSGSIVVTSSVPGEGKSTTAINAATTLAEAGQDVLLIDADLRRPQVAKYLELDGAVGLTTVLLGRVSLLEAVQQVAGGKLDVLTSGQVPPNPSELLGSSAMHRVIEAAVETYDLVIMDAPPLLPVTDAAILAKLTGGAIVVVGSGSVRRPQLQAALEMIETVGGHVFGLVLNKVRGRDSDRYAYVYTPDVSPSRTARSGGKPLPGRVEG